VMETLKHDPIFPYRVWVGFVGWAAPGTCMNCCPNRQGI
jgi:hypothetical protein